MRGQARVDQQRDRRRPHARGVQNLADDVEVAAQHVVVVGLRLPDRLNRAGRRPRRGSPRAAASDPCRGSWESNSMNGTPALAASCFMCSTSSGSPFWSSTSSAAFLREGARGDQPPRGRGLAGAGRAEQHHVLSGPRTAAAVPCSPSAVIDTYASDRGPRPFVNELALASAGYNRSPSRTRRARVARSSGVRARGFEAPHPALRSPERHLAPTTAPATQRRHQRQQNHRRLPRAQADRDSQHDHSDAPPGDTGSGPTEHRPATQQPHAEQHRRRRAASSARGRREPFWGRASRHPRPGQMPTGRGTASSTRRQPRAGSSRAARPASFLAPRSTRLRPLARAPARRSPHRRTHRSRPRSSPPRSTWRAARAPRSAGRRTFPSARPRSATAPISEPRGEVRSMPA